MGVKEIRRRLLDYKTVDTTLPEVQEVCRGMNCDEESLQQLTTQVQQSMDRVTGLDLSPLRTGQLVPWGPIILEGSNANTGSRKKRWLLTFDRCVVDEDQREIFDWTLRTEENPFSQRLTLLELEDRLNRIARKIAWIEWGAKARTFLKDIGTLPRVISSQAFRERARFRRH